MGQNAWNLRRWSFWKVITVSLKCDTFVSIMSQSVSLQAGPLKRFIMIIVAIICAALKLWIITTRRKGKFLLCQHSHFSFNINLEWMQFFWRKIIKLLVFINHDISASLRSKMANDYYPGGKGNSCFANTAIPPLEWMHFEGKLKLLSVYYVFPFNFHQSILFIFQK